jgi:NAD+ diphosphatase
VPDVLSFSGSPLDRESLRRRDRSWLTAQSEAPESRYLPVWKLDPLVKKGEAGALAWARSEFFDGLDPRPEPVLLGTAEDIAHFAVDVSSVDDPAVAFGVADVASFEDLRAAAGRLPGGDVAIAGQARAVIDWHARHRFCAACGGSTRSVLGGAQRRCTECEADHFPRTDPVAIAVVGRGERCLLGRSPGWPEKMFSALAGFVEPAETIEEAVRREVLEESGIRVGEVRYHACQPWPFPSSLMIGCIAEGESEAITIDKAEIEEARWFGRDEVRAALAGEGGDLIIPPPFAIAHHLIRAWSGRSE